MDDHGGDVGRDTIADWLGIEQDGELLCRSTGLPLGEPNQAIEFVRTWFWMIRIGVAWVLIMGLSQTLPWDEDLGLRGILGMLGCFLYAVIELAVGDRRRRTSAEPEWWSHLRASADGVDAETETGRFFVAWPELRDIKALHPLRGIGWQVTAQGKRFRFQREVAGAEELERTVRNVLAAKAAGRRLWDPAVLPEGALSRADGDEEDADRGLSRADAS